MFQEKSSINLTKTEKGSVVRVILTGKWSLQAISFRPNFFQKNCSLNAYNILFVQKTSYGTVAHLSKVTAKKHSSHDKTINRE